MRKGSKPKVLSKTLKIDNLALDVTEPDLYKLFEDKGTLVKCQISTDKFKRSIGKAELAYEKVEEATKAKEELNDHEINGNKIKISYKMSALSST